MRIALVIPPSPFLISDRVFPFLGPLQIAALAREQGHDVKVIDLTGYSLRNPNKKPTLEDVKQEAQELLLKEAWDVDLVGFYSLAAQHPFVVEFNNLVKNQLYCITALGGPHANTAPERCVADGFDYVIVSDQGGGGGEPGFLELIQRIKNKKSDPLIKVASRLGVTYENDRFPLPARDLIDLKSYVYYLEGERATSIVTTTGCPFACNFSVTGDTWIFTDKGFENIASLVEGVPETKSCPHGGQLSFYNLTRNIACAIGNSSAISVIDEGLRQVFELHTENGLKVKATAEHPFLSLVDGQPQWRQVRDLHPGDWLVLKSPENILPTELLKLNSPKLPDVPYGGFNKRLHKTPDILCEDLAWFIGFLIGDGCLPKDRRPALHVCIAPDIRERLHRTVEKVFNLKLNEGICQSTSNMLHGWIYSRAVYEFCVQIVGVSPDDKFHVPLSIRQSPVSVIKAFIQGLFDADGYEYRPKREYLVTVSYDLAKEVANCILMTGAVPSIQKIKGQDEKYSYRVGYYYNDRIPTEKALYKSSKSGKWYWRTPRNPKRFLDIRRRTLEKSGLPHELNKSGWHFVRVKKIEPGLVEKVYDLQVENEHCFLANGLIAHNCSHWGGYRKLEMRSPENVRREIQQIKKDYNWRAFMAYDDEINLRRDFVEDFLPMLQSENIIWRAFFKNGPNLTKEPIFQKMADSGCVQLCTGAESADPTILKNTRKGATLENNTDFVKLCVKHGIKPKLFTQVGLPGENPETVKKLRNWLVAMVDEGLADADVTITTPYEGTPLYDTPEKFDIHFDKEALDYSKESILYKGIPGQYKSYVWHDNLTTDDIVEARQWVEDEFRNAAGLPPLVKDDG